MEKSPYVVYLYYMLMNCIIVVGSGGQHSASVMGEGTLVNKYPRIMRPLYPVFQIESYKGNEYLEYDLADYGTSGVIW